jgi:hypothetical protein
MDIPLVCAVGITNSSTTAATMPQGAGADDPDHLVPVAAGELFEWAWLATGLADWLNAATEATQQDFHRFFDGLRSPEKTAMFCEQISERIAALLDGDRGAP